MSQPLEPGDIVYFWPKYNSKTAPSKKRLSLRRWHGPALLVALEGHNAGYVSFKGQLSKCAREHLRSASSMEQISAEVWHDAIQDCVEAALHDVKRQSSEDVGPNLPPPPTPSVAVDPSPLPTVPEQHAVQDDLPPVAPTELFQALDGGGLGVLGGGSHFGSELPGSGSLSRRASSMAASSRCPSRQMSHAAPGTPVPQLITGASQASPVTPPLSSRLSASLDAARELDEQTGVKRPSEVESEQPQKMLREDEEHSVLVATSVIQNVLKTKQALVSRYAKDTANQSVPDVEQAPKQDEILENILKNATMHPLRAIQLQVEKDKKADGNLAVQDHGSWSGKWPLPTRTSWEAHEISCALWPCGEHEVNAAKTARREVKWKDIPMHERAEYRKAAETGWKVQVDNGAFEILSDEESERIKAKLRASGQLHKILTPRYIYTDKHDGLRSDSNPLPLLANARVVIPGYKDETAYSVRKDAPTSSRSSQHMLFIVAAARKWCLWSADVKSAFLKGEYFQEGERELYICNIRCTSADEPMLPFSAGGLARVRKGVFGLADSPRRWYLRLNKSLLRLGWRRSDMDAAQWFLYGADGSLQGIVVSHVDDLLMGGTDLAGKSLRALGDELGFGSLETGCFTYCGKQIKQNADMTIEVSMQHCCPCSPQDCPCSPQEAT